MHLHGQVLWLKLAAQLPYIYETTILKIADVVEQNGSMQPVVITRIASENGSTEGFAFLLRIMTWRIQIADIHTEVGALVDITRKIKREVVFRMIGRKAFLIRNIGVCHRCAVKTNILRSKNIRLVSRAKKEIHFPMRKVAHSESSTPPPIAGCTGIAEHSIAASVKVNLRLHRGNEVAVECPSDGVVVHHIAHREIDGSRINKRSIRNAVIVTNLPGANIFLHLGEGHALRLQSEYAKEEIEHDCATPTAERYVSRKSHWGAKLRIIFEKRKFLVIKYQNQVQKVHFFIK